MTTDTNEHLVGLKKKELLLLNFINTLPCTVQLPYRYSPNICFFPLGLYSNFIFSVSAVIRFFISFCLPRLGGELSRASLPLMLFSVYIRKDRGMSSIRVFILNGGLKTEELKEKRKRRTIWILPLTTDGWRKKLFRLPQQQLVMGWLLGVLDGSVNLSGWVFIPEVHITLPTYMLLRCVVILNPGTYLSTGNALFASLNLLTEKKEVRGKGESITTRDASYSLANVLKLFKSLGMHREILFQVITH